MRPLRLRGRSARGAVRGRRAEWPNVSGDPTSVPTLPPRADVVHVAPCRPPHVLYPSLCAMQLLSCNLLMMGLSCMPSAVLHDPACPTHDASRARTRMPRARVCSRCPMHCTSAAGSRPAGALQGADEGRAVRCERVPMCSIYYICHRMYCAHTYICVDVSTRVHMCMCMCTTHYSLLTTHHSLLTTRYPLLTTHYSLLTAHCHSSLLTAHYSLVTTHCLLLTTHYSLLTTHW